MAAHKPFLEIRSLVSGLVDCGLQIPNLQTAETYLRKVGYFRSGGYRYVFRELLPASEQDKKHREFRSDTYISGATLADVMRLEEFDARLRHTLLVGLSDFEVRLRAEIAHVLARRDKYAHTDKVFLDEDACSQILSTSRTKFDAWEETYREAINSSSEEDFIAHHLLKYGHPVPVWVTIEVLSFGNLPYLFDLLQVEDRREVALKFGVKHEAKFAAWVRALCDLRNYCAHGARTFNRLMKRAVAVVPASFNAGLLSHVTGPTFTPTPDGNKRLYIVAAVLAYSLRSHVAGSGWNDTFKTCMGKFPKIDLAGDGSLLVTPEMNMGFPHEWKTLPLWS